MNKEELMELLKGGEGENLEFKPGLSQLNDILCSISALANKKGGKILIGITDSGKITGVEIGRDTIERLTNKIRDCIEPRMYPAISIEKIDDRGIIIIEVDESKDKPVLALGRAYKRVGKSTLKMGREEQERIVLKKNEDKVSFDSEICKDATFNDIDEESIGRFKRRYEEINKIALNSSNKDLLKSLKCIKEIDGRLKVTNAGVLLFSKNSQVFFPMNYITIARYPKIEKEQNYSDIKDFYGNLFELIELSDNYVM